MNIIVTGIYIISLFFSISSGLQMMESNQTSVSSYRYSMGGKTGTTVVPVVYIRFGDIPQYMRVSIQ